MYATKRHGFAMILAIVVVVLVALGGVMLLSNATMGSKSVGTNYLHAQAELLAMSATEFAVMRAQDVNTSKNAANHCLEHLNINVVDSAGAAAYSVNTTIRYSFKGAVPLGCTPPNADVNTTLAQNTGNDTTMLIDVVVTSNANLTTESIRVFKRTWQKL
ncbi:MAG: hypothetical protein Q7U69_03445 [Sulfuricurvum sp.]|uniref:hypothetical protein n=1 Tax=Sulfuricurvum sp. TaxID=2025608 RepID=UPI00271F4C8E|nr:hypothetical protein [Sulfuricurvum sp.]MDO9055574.1 hypothetical protein [Sulfuricurvum sp.]